MSSEIPGVRSVYMYNDVLRQGIRKGIVFVYTSGAARHGLSGTPQSSIGGRWADSFDQALAKAEEAKAQALGRLRAEEQRIASLEFSLPRFGQCPYPGWAKYYYYAYALKRGIQGMWAYSPGKGRTLFVEVALSEAEKQRATHLQVLAERIMALEELQFAYPESDSLPDGVSSAEVRYVVPSLWEGIQRRLVWVLEDGSAYEIDTEREYGARLHAPTYEKVLCGAEEVKSATVLKHLSDARHSVEAALAVDALTFTDPSKV